MSNLFEVTDPRDRTVICTEACWNDHILGSRPFMRGWEQEIIDAIEHPTIGIFQDADRVDRHIYYRRRTKQPRYIKVVVSFSQSDIGTVITAFPTDSPKSGEKLIWPKSNT